LLSPFQKVQEHPFLICGWQVMIKSLSMEFELQQGITFASKGQFMWFFLEQFSLDPYYHNHASHFIKTHHKKSAFFTWLHFEFWWEKVNLKRMHYFHFKPMPFALKQIFRLASKGICTVPLVT
jgi:hypothetical protein